MHNHLVSDVLQQYLDTHSSPEPPALQALNRETYANVLAPHMLSGHYQGRVLSMFSFMLRPMRVLEIGTYTGYSAICLAEGMPEGGMLHTIDINDELHEQVRLHLYAAGAAHKITCHHGPAAKVIPTLSETWDLVFIDADKAAYPLYYDLVFDSVRPGGIIISDNVLKDGDVVNPEALAASQAVRNMAAYNQKLSRDPRTDCVILPVRDGLSVVRKK